MTAFIFIRLKLEAKKRREDEKKLEKDKKVSWVLLISEVYPIHISQYLVSFCLLDWVKNFIEFYGIHRCFIDTSCMKAQ